MKIGSWNERPHTYAAFSTEEVAVDAPTDPVSAIFGSIMPKTVTVQKITCTCGDTFTGAGTTTYPAHCAQGNQRTWRRGS